MNLLKIVLLASLIVLASVTAVAQKKNPRRAGKNPDPGKTSLTRRLLLSQQRHHRRRRSLLPPGNQNPAPEPKSRVTRNTTAVATGFASITS